MPYFLKTDWVLLYVIPFSASYFTSLNTCNCFYQLVRIDSDK